MVTDELSLEQLLLALFVAFFMVFLTVLVAVSSLSLDLPTSILPNSPNDATSSRPSGCQKSTKLKPCEMDKFITTPSSGKERSLLDQSPEQFEFPPLEPSSALLGLTGLQGSPIEFLFGSGESEAVSPKSTVSDQRSVQSKNSVQSKQSVSKKPTRPIQSVQTKILTQSKWPRWALHDASVFASSEEELRAARLHGPGWERRGVKDSMFFQWGIRYVPHISDQNVYRAVTIDRLPRQVTLDRILSRIRGGQVYSATLCDTIPLTGSPTALIIFVHQKGALRFLRRVAQHGFYVGFTPAAVHPVPTPTYLLNASMEKQIKEFGRTRCLIVHSSRPYLKKNIHQVLTRSVCRDYVEGFGEKDAAGEATIRFFTVKMALVAYDLLTGTARLPSCTVRFDKDPCADSE
ncbi:uncharacterized protein N7459_004531 [Penicillium hispanicum]|uniref:uncharacterized protein n=1 Tax=Penicillium hispanicum TaxID=1080232 RepID=UPI0025425420|nr:uncharacterized protein N7459_004531 [Penicillium hispanicum]KAJ5584731.1 hypothetical protein N7459_004531 [Penicillium hispanicum]